MRLETSQKFKFGVHTIGNRLNHCTKGADTLLKAVKWDLIFGTALLRFECRHRVFKYSLETMFMSTVSRKAKPTVIKYHISYLMH